MTLPASVVLGALLLVILLGSRRSALLALVAGTMFLAQGVSISLGGISLYPMRLLALAAFLRVALKKEITAGQLNALDKMIVVAYGYATLVFVLRTAFGYGTSDAISQTSTLSKVGGFGDVVMGYFAFRGLLQSDDDLRSFLLRFPMLLIPYTGALLIERTTGSNPLAFLGAQPSMWFDFMGRARCFGSFGHPSILGTFGASFLLLYVALWLNPSDRLKATVGATLCLAIVLLANSGSPVSFVAVGMAVWALWSFRQNIRAIKWSAGVGLAVVIMMMNAPIWYLPTRMSGIVGGSGWHRSYLMERGFANFDKWWLAGMPMDLTVGWFPYVVLGAADMTNLFLAFGVDGGLLALLLLIAMIAVAFRRIGRALLAARRSPGGQLCERLLWGLGALVVAHVINFFAITYFDQFNMIWMMQLAAVSALTTQALRAQRQSRATGTGPPVAEKAVALPQPQRSKSVRSSVPRPPLY